MIEEADRNGDGQIDEEEFYRIMKKTSLFVSVCPLLAPDACHVRHNLHLSFTFCCLPLLAYNAVRRPLCGYCASQLQLPELTKAQLAMTEPLQVLYD